MKTRGDVSAKLPNAATHTDHTAVSAHVHLVLESSRHHGERAGRSVFARFGPSALICELQYQAAG